jgi:phosphoglycolate phosphatase-like HAD superfamily hydrolase
VERLILFDIDGTLTRTQNGYLPFNEAICKRLASRRYPYGVPDGKHRSDR